MAFQTNHTAPGGFVADAQLKDGSSLGTWLWYDLGTGSGTLLVELRTRKIGRNDRFAVEQKLGTGPWQVVGREALRNYAETAPPAAATVAPTAGVPDVAKTYTNIQAWIDYVATSAELSALGISTGSPLSNTPNSFLIPFVMNADGKVKPYYEPIDPAKQQQELNDLLKSSLTVSSQAFLPKTANADGTTSTNWGKVAVVVVVGAAIAYGIYRFIKGK